jgi:hypothetical protein
MALPANFRLAKIFARGKRSSFFALASTATKKLVEHLERNYHISSFQKTFERYLKIVPKSSVPIDVTNT